MKLSQNPTRTLFLNLSESPEWEACTFGILIVTDQFKGWAVNTNAIAGYVKSNLDTSFYELVCWCPLDNWGTNFGGEEDDEKTQIIEQAQRNGYAYVSDYNEWDVEQPEYKIDAETIQFRGSGVISFKGYTPGSEEVATEEINIIDILNEIESWEATQQIS